MKQSNNETIRIVFFGASKFVIPIIEVLRSKLDLVLVITTEQNSNDAVPAYCKQNNIDFISVSNLSDKNLKSLIINLKSPLGILAYFGLILPEEILNIFPHGILNIHPSLLPKYRGPTPGQTALLNGDTKTGVTLIKLDEEVDHGPIFAQVKEKIEQTDTSETLYERLFAKGARLLEKNIDDYLNNKITLAEQDHSKATFTNHLTRQSGYIDLANPPAKEQLDRMIRSYYPWPGVWSKLKVESGKMKIIKLLPKKKLQVEGKKPVSLQDFINGYPEASPVILNLIQDLDRR